MRRLLRRFIRTPARIAPATATALALALLTGGCATATWLGYSAPASGDVVDVAPDYPYCMDVGLQNLDARQAAAVREAARDVCAITVSPRFRSELIAGEWLASCERGRGGAQDIVEGAALAVTFDAPAPFSVHPRRPPGGETWSDADLYAGFGRPADNRVAIDPARIEGWYDDDPAARAALVDALTREITHLGSSAYSDHGHGSEHCPVDRLASHVAGDLAARLWLEGVRAPRGRTAEYVGYQNTPDASAWAGISVEPRRAGGDSLVVSVGAPFGPRCLVPAVHGSVQDDDGALVATVAWEASSTATEECEKKLDPSRYALWFVVPDAERLRGVRMEVQRPRAEFLTGARSEVFEVRLVRD